MLKRNTAALVLLLTLSACGRDEATVTKTAEVPAWAKIAPEQIAEAKKHGVPVKFENDLGMRFVLIPPGGGSAHPVHMQITEVTNLQFELFRSSHKEDRYGTTRDSDPVTAVSYEDAIYFARWLTARESKKPFQYRLPTNREWASCCVPGGISPWGEDESKIGEYANVADLSNRKRWEGLGVATDDGFPTLAPVASFKPNVAGFYDLIGNVSEWCSDPWERSGESHQKSHELRPGTQTFRVIRGGNWHVTGGPWDGSARERGDQREGYPGLVGFRLVVERNASVAR